jgi:hypothetical protein
MGNWKKKKTEMCHFFEEQTDTFRYSKSMMVSIKCERCVLGERSFLLRNTSERYWNVMSKMWDACKQFMLISNSYLTVYLFTKKFLEQIASYQDFPRDLNFQLGNKYNEGGGFKSWFYVNYRKWKIIDFVSKEVKFCFVGFNVIGLITKTSFERYKYFRP